MTKLPNDKVLDWSRLEELADEKINVSRNFKSFWEGVENILRKGERAGSQHFLLFPQSFQNASFSKSLKVGTVWESPNHLPTTIFLDWSKKKAYADNQRKKVTEKLKFVLEILGNIVGKGENAGNQHFLLFPQCFQKATFFYKIVKIQDCVVKS